MCEGNIDCEDDSVDSVEPTVMESAQFIEATERFEEVLFVSHPLHVML